MKITARLTTTFCCLFLLINCSQRTDSGSDRASAPADLLFVNGPVYTVDNARSWATAVGIRDGRIVYVGFDEGAAALQGPSTRTIDLDGKMLMPSFQDSHIHPIDSGMQELTVSLSELTTLDEYLQRIKVYADDNPDAEWILGGGWSMAVFGPGAKASKTLIDDVVADRPVFLTSSDGHSGWANSKALELAGIDQDTQDPITGMVDRDPETGEIIGSLQEGAMGLMTSHIPPATDEMQQAGLRYSIDLLNRYGITALNDAAVNADGLETYRSLDDAGDLTMRVLASMWWQPERGLEQIADFQEMREQHTRGNVRATSVKIMQDGVLENFTGAMSEPYLVDGDPTGIPMVEPEALKRAVSALDADGFQVHFHAIGDAAITHCLDAVETAIADNGNAYRRHHISHLQLIHPNDLPRFRELGVIANFQPLWAYADAYVTDLTLPFIGEERGRWMYPIRSVLNHGGMIAFGSDWFVSTANPFPQIETAVTRTDAEGDDEPFMPYETIDLQTAIAAFTINAAYLNGIETDTGSIEIGKLADMIVIDRNLFEIPAKELSEVQVLLTLFEGRPVHGSLESL